VARGDRNPAARHCAALSSEAYPLYRAPGCGLRQSRAFSENGGALLPAIDAGALAELDQSGLRSKAADRVLQFNIATSDSSQPPEHGCA